MKNFELDRRTVVKGGLAAAAATAMPFGGALAQSFPSENMKVMVPTREGGGADRLLRLFWGTWKKALKVELEASFFPGGAGRVGYEKYMGLAPDDCHTLLFGNLGPEVLNWVVKPPTSFKFPGDYKYFLRVDSDPSCVFVSRDSDIKTLDDLVKVGQTRELKVAASRIAHPAVLGLLILAKQKNMKVNIVPFSGGRNTLAAVSTREMDCGALPTGGVAQRDSGFKVLGLFDDTNRAPEATENAPTVNKHLGVNIPPMVSARAFAIKTSAIEKHPDRFKLLQDTAKAVFDDPAFKEAVIKDNLPWEFVQYGGLAECEKEANDMMTLGTEFKDLLTGKA